MKLYLKLRNETKTCYRFETGNKDDNTLITLYLKKSDVAAAGINPQKGIVVTVEENKEV